MTHANEDAMAAADAADRSYQGDPDEEESGRQQTGPDDDEPSG